MFQKISRYSILFALLLRITQAVQFVSKDTMRREKSREMFRYMNELTDPCADFYEFTCGNYDKYKMAYMNANMTMPRLSTTQFVINAKHRQELETNDETDTEADKNVKRFYRSCLNTSPMTYANENRIAFLKQLGQMPVLEGDNWQENDFDWVITAAEIFHRTSLSLIIGIYIINDFSDSSTNVVHISQSSFIKEQFRFYINVRYAANRRTEIDNAAFFLEYSLGVERTLAIVTAREIIDFKIGLAQGIADSNTSMHYQLDTSPLTSIQEMQEKYLPDFDTKLFLSIALDFVPPQLYVHHQYLANTLNVIKNTPKRIVANFMFYNYFQMFPFQFESDRSLNRMLCADYTQKCFYKNLDSIFYRKHITPEMEDGIYHMWQEIKSSFQSVLQSPKLSWLQEDTRRNALEKLNAMRLRLATDVDDVDFAEDLAQLDISEFDYLKNIDTLMVLDGNRTRASVHTTPKPVAWPFFSPAYSRSENAIVMPIVYVQQYHIYANSYPNAYNFATLGFVLGHEMHHGFDAARRYDSEGIIRNWWDAQSDMEYLKREKCFIDQYKRYSLGGIFLPEMNYQAENVADIGGLSVAYAAYLKWYNTVLAPNRILEALPGINYTNKQLFFISYAQWWCRSYELDTVALKVASHVPPKFRVIGPLSNFHEFSIAFDCQNGSPMNPRNKCRIY